MMNLPATLKPFISTTSFTAQGEVVRIDGKSADAKKTTIDGDSVVLLYSASQQESNFDWTGKTIKEVVIDDILIYDASDVACLAWFIYNNIKIDLSKSFVSPDALGHLNGMCDSLALRNMKVVKGSSITLPIINGLSGMSRTDAARMKCEKIGFTVIQSFGFSS